MNNIPQNAYTSLRRYDDAFDDGGDDTTTVDDNPFWAEDAQASGDRFNVLEELEELNQHPHWVCWELAPNADDPNKRTKVPYDPKTGTCAKSNDPSTWGTFEQAVHAYTHGEKYDGIGFELATGTGLVFVDFDHCIGDDGRLDPWVAKWVERLDTYTEVSQSGRGIHCIAKGKLPPGGRKCNRVEMYDANRYMALTGWVWNSFRPIRECTETLAELHRDAFPEAPKPAHPSPVTLHDTGNAPSDDEELLAKAFNAKNGAKVRALWNGDTSAYGGDESDADLALCSELAFWTGRDPQRIDRLFRKSALYRPKWDENRGANETYGQRTIRKALEDRTDFYDWPTPQHKNNGNGVHAPKDGTREEAKAGKRKSQATELFELARDQLDLWHTPEGDEFAGTRDGIHVFRIKDEATLQWLSRLHYEATGNTPSDDTLRTAHKQLRAEATFNAPTRPTYVRVAPEGAEADPIAIWVDLADGTGRAVRITAQGWDVVPSPSVALWRPKVMQALPEPVRGHDDALQDLFAMFHMEESAQAFVTAFLVDALRPTGPYPILQVHGEQGSGKSTLCTFLVNLIDPHNPALISPHQNEEDLVVTARRAHLVAYTNVSTIPAWFADALCRLTTDGGFGRRQRYTDDEEVTFKDRRPVILNGIPDLTHVARRGDLADRTLRVSLDPIPDDRRRVDAELQQRYAELRPRILGALYTRVSRALAQYHTIRLPSLPRLATTAVWVTASEPDAEARTFLRTFYKARDLEAQAAIQDDPIATAIETLANQGEWHGTAGDLLKHLEATVPTAGDKAAHFPRDARALGSYITRIAPLLRKVGVDVSKARNEAQRTITICRTLAMTRDDKA
jgi:hypothetical protein